MPVGQKLGGFDLTIKTAKKKWQIIYPPKDAIDNFWMQQALLTDETGDILADVKLKGNIPLQRTQQLHVTVAEIQQGETGVKLYVDQYEIPTLTEPPFVPDFTEADKIVRSKIKCWLVAGMFQSGQYNMEGILVDIESPTFAQIIDSIIKG